ncbi:hypothetical protein [Herbiconiux liukaitaii]|uniref:hypothetical protein n=1 Tax=Herbiconiux liukaitaii TaxID=3342799 RepID=UPI0035BB40B8
MTHPDPRADGQPPRDLNPDPAPQNSLDDQPVLTRRQLREQRLAEIAAAETTALQASGAAAPLTRRQLRERELALRAEEIADLEIAPAGSAPLDPHVDLPLPPAPDAEPTDAAPTDVAPDATSPAAAADTAPADAESADAAPAHDEPAVETNRQSAARDDDEDDDVVEALVIADDESTPVSPTPAASASASRRRDLRPSAPAVAEEPGFPTDLIATRSEGTRRRQPAIRSAASSRAERTGPASPTSSSSPATRRSGPAAARSKRRSWAKSGITAVAMAFVVAMTAVVALPATVSADPDDALAMNLSLSSAAPATQQLVTAADASTEFVDRDGYSVSDAGELQAAGYSTAQLLVGRSLAQELVDAMDSGKLVGSVPDHLKEIRWIAQGVTVPDCGVDYRVLEIIAIAVRNFDQVGVSDINRKCTGQIEGAGTNSSHYIDGGGHAVDFYLLDNKSLNGADPGTLKMISLLDPVMPVGSRVGQAGCRASAGVTVNLTNWTEFDDTCTHMHVDVPVTDAPLLLPAE